MIEKVVTEPSAKPFFGPILTRRHFLTSRSIFTAIGIISVVGIGVAAAMKRGDTGQQPAAADKTTSNDIRVLDVEVIVLRRGAPITTVQTFSGTVQPRRTSVLASKFGGRVETIFVETGSKVSPGQILAQLDQTQTLARIDAAKASLEMALAQLAELENGPRQQDISAAESKVTEAKANLKLREASFERIKTLYASSSVSLQELDEATFQLDAIRAQLAAAKQDLHKLNEGSRAEQVLAGRAQVANIRAEIRVLESDIRDHQILAPYAGQIQSRFVDEGTIVSPGQQMLQIVEGPPYEVRVGIPASVTDCLNEEKIAVSQDGTPLKARIDRMSPALNLPTQTRELVLELSLESSRQVSLGSPIRVEVDTRDPSRGFWVPTSALTAGSRGLWAVYVATSPQSANNDSASNESASPAIIERRQVELLRAGEDWSEIQGPVSSGERIVASGTHRITPGQRVNCTAFAPLGNSRSGNL